MTITEVASRLTNAKKCRQGYIACCPAHDDKNPSLSVNEKEGKILVNCFAGCSTDAIVSSIGLTLRDLFIEPTSRNSDILAQYIVFNIPKIGQILDKKFTFEASARRYAQSSQKRETAVYEYADTSGEVLYENVCYEPKGFRQRRPR